jgi:uncharacterized protein (DUF924 family)
MMHFQEIIQFWFSEIEPKKWYAKDGEFDALIRQRFGAIHRSANAGELVGWRDCALGRLAEIIILDQFSRNLGRDTASAFASDNLALCLAQHAIAANADQQLIAAHRTFMYMPFMHSESLLIHEQAVTLFTQAGLENNLAFEFKHQAIIERFGRYPHRNAILGRDSTPEELAFLEQPGSSF